jgi:hypothetical protein
VDRDDRFASGRGPDIRVGNADIHLADRDMLNRRFEQPARLVAGLAIAVAAVPAVRGAITSADTTPNALSVVAAFGAEQDLAPGADKVTMRLDGK